ncbi:MAG: hypothetical protein GXP62_07230 [Oligoflexia bacterium]|nr:hypothetical protein [Oligoflexia bacterium]
METSLCSRPFLKRGALLFALGFLSPTVGCGLRTTHRGLVSVTETGRARLEDYSGVTWRVSAAGQGAVLAGLDGCEVEITGSRFGHRLGVSDWRVESAPGGGQPFVGRLRLFGSNWLIDDRNSGQAVIIDMDAAPELATHVGSLIIVVGYVSGAQMVRPVRWWVVAP